MNYNTAMKIQSLYQYISLNQEVEKTIQLLKKMPRASITPILDLEDSLEIPLDKERTLVLKKRARQNIHDLSDKISGEDLQLELNLRINFSGSEHFEEDIRLLTELKDRIDWNIIVLPKVHDASVLKQYTEALSEISYKDLIVIAESKEFLENDTEILDACEKLNVNKVQFGHWDFFQSMHEFPVPRPEDEKFWEIVRELVRLCEERNFTYSHTAFPHLLDHDKHRSVIGYLDSICTRPFGLAVLTFSQGKEVTRQGREIRPFKPYISGYTTEEKDAIARKIIDFFENQSKAEFSFNINANHLFIAPHEYLEALYYVKHK